MRSQSKFYKLRRYFAVVLAVLSFSTSTPVFADQFTDQINQLQQQIASSQQQANAARNQQRSLQGQIDVLNAQIDTTTAQLQLTQTSYDKLIRDLQLAEAKLLEKKSVLGESIRAIYLETNLTPIEMLASSNNFSEFVDKQQYLQSLKTSVEESIAEITEIKQQLEAQKQQQSDLLVQQTGLREELAGQKSSLNGLLAQAQGQEAQAKQAATNSQQQLAGVYEARRAAQEAANNSGGGGGGGTSGSHPGYESYANSVGGVDNWAFYTRQCTSYVAWVRANMGKPLNASAQLRSYYPYASVWGNIVPTNGAQFNDRALQDGRYGVGNTPQKNAILVWEAYSYQNGYQVTGYAGHVAIVTSVINSNTVTVDEYNYGVPESFTSGRVVKLDQISPRPQFVY